MNELKDASAVFSFLSYEHPTLSHIRGSLRCSKTKSMDHRNYCLENHSKAAQHLAKAKSDARKDELRKRQLDEMHKKILAEKQLQKNCAVEEEERMKEEVRKKAKLASEK